MTHLLRSIPLCVALVAIASSEIGQAAGLKLRDIDLNGDGEASEDEIEVAHRKVTENRSRKTAAKPGTRAAAAPVPVDASLPVVDAGAYTYRITKGGAYAERAPLASVLTEGLVSVEDLGDALEVTVPKTIREMPKFNELSAAQQGVVRRVYSDAKAEAQPESKKSLWDRAITTVEDNFSIGENAESITENFDERDPARLSWTKAKGEKSFYTIDAAVDFHPKFLSWWEDNAEGVAGGKIVTTTDWDWDARLRFFFEAHVSTQAGANQNSLEYALPFEFRVQAPNAEADERNAIAGKDTNEHLITSHNFALRPTYLTDRSAGVRTLGVDLRYEPTLPALGINLGAPRVLRGGSKALEWQIQAAVGFSFRSIEEGSKVLPEDVLPADTDNYGLFVADISAEATLWEKLTLRATYGASVDLFGDVQSYDLFQADIVLELDERQHFSVGVTYTKGEVEPTFEEIDSFTAWVGVKF